MGKEAFLQETSRIHSSMACQRGAIELFRDTPVFGADEAFATLAAEDGTGRLGGIGCLCEPRQFSGLVLG